MSPLYPLSSQRETQFLRASVVDAAMTLGPKVANLIFADSIMDRSDDRRAKILYIPELYSPSVAGPLSAFSQDSTASDVSNSNESGIRKSEEYSAPSFNSKGLPIKDYYLESPFVLISKVEEELPRPHTPEELNGTTSRKGIKNFIFSSRKRSKEGSPEPKHPSISKPRRIYPALDDAVTPTPIFSTNTPLSSTRSETASSTAKSTPTKLRKRIQRVNSGDWDFKDPDRPSFFFEQTSKNQAEIKFVGRKTDDEDYGYVSEGTGLFFKDRARRKVKATNPQTGRKGRAVDDHPLSNLRQDSNLSSSTFVPLPIAERFVRKPPPLKPIENPSRSAVTKANILPPDSSLIVPSSSHQSKDNSPMSDTSFAIMPDLNIAKRLGLNKYASELGQDGVVGADNELKLRMMDKLLRKVEDPDLDSAPSQPVPAINVIPPPTKPLSGMAEGSITLPIRGKHSPFPISPVRGRESPFPTKPVLGHPLNTPRLTTAPLRFRLPPERYKDIDLPRSVRSSFEKDLAREEGAGFDNSGMGSPSVYSKFDDEIKSEIN